MAEKFKETARVISQESLGGQIYSMWIQTEQIAAAAKPGQFVSVYCKNEAAVFCRVRFLFVRSTEREEDFGLSTVWQVQERRSFRI